MAEVAGRDCPYPHWPPPMSICRGEPCRRWMLAYMSPLDCWHQVIHERHVWGVADNVFSIHFCRGRD